MVHVVACVCAVYVCMFVGRVALWLHAMALLIVQRHADNVRRQHKVVLAQRNLAELLIDGRPGVVQRRTLADDDQRAADAAEGEHPQQKAVQHHRHEFPVLDDLRSEIDFW